MEGHHAEGLSLLERARSMMPDSWWPHYALGWIYSRTGEYERALASLERAVALRPGLYDAEAQIERLRPLVARAPRR